MRANLALLTMLATAALAGPPIPSEQATLCLQGERVQFNCNTGQELVSLCASNGAAGALTYRRGMPDRIKLLHVAEGGDSTRFGATTMPLEPGAQVQQIWFDQGDQRHWMGVCVGGMCPQEAVVAMLRGQTVLSREVCRYQPTNLAWIAADVVRFGSDVEDSFTNSRLVALDHVFLPLEKLFISRCTVPR